MTVVRPELQFGVAELNGDGVVRGFVEKPRSEHWVNGGFFCFEPSVLELLEDDSVLEREPLARLAAGGRAARVPPRGVLGLHGHLQGRGPAQRPVGGRAGAVEAVELSGHSVARHRRLRPARRAGWSARCSRRGAAVTVIRRDERRRLARCAAWASSASVDVVHGDICADGLVARALAEYEVESVFHLAAQTIVPTANRSPLLDVRDEHPRHLAAARGVPAPRRRAGDRRLLGQGLRPARRAPVPGGLRAPAAATPTTSPRRRPTCSPAPTGTPGSCRWRSPGSPTCTAAATPTRSRLVPEAVTAALAGRSPVVRSDGSPERDFLYVEDAVAAYLAICGRARRGDEAPAARPSTPAAASRTACSTSSS